MFYQSKQLARALLDAIKEQPDKESEIVKNFVDFCRVKNITNQLSKVLFYLEKEGQKISDQQKVLLKTKEKIPEDLIQDIKKYIQAPNDVEVKTEQAENLLGGFVARWQGKVFDASARGQLEKLKIKMLSETG